MKGIYFDDIHSFYDLNLVLSKVDIPPAVPKITMVDIPGGDGSVDLTEAFGEVKFKDRECTFTFTVFPYDDFEEKKREVNGLLNGKRCKITLDKDPDYYWEGRLSINEYASNKNLHQIVVGATVAPYKVKQEVTTVFAPNALDGVRVVLYNGRKPVCPVITATENDLIHNGPDGNIYHQFSETGDFIIPELKLGFGENVFWVTTTNGMTFTYQERDL